MPKMVQKTWMTIFWEAGNGQRNNTRCSGPIHSWIKAYTRPGRSGQSNLKLKDPLRIFVRDLLKVGLSHGKVLQEIDGYLV